MRKINKIVVHTSFTKATQDIGAKEIELWHTGPKSQGHNGWSTIGYHHIIRRGGALESPLPIQYPGIHARGHNQDSIAICLVGGMDKKRKPIFNFDRYQMATLEGLVNSLRLQFPKAEICGHNQISKKECPCFNVPAYFS